MIFSINSSLHNLKSSLIQCVKWFARERQLIMGILVAGASLLVVWFVQMPSDTSTGGLRLFVGAECGVPFDIRATLTPNSDIGVTAAVSFLESSNGYQGERPAIISTKVCKAIHFSSTLPIGCFTFDPFYRTCINIRPLVNTKPTKTFEYTVFANELSAFRGTVYANIRGGQKKESYSERTLVATVGIFKSGSLGHTVQVAIDTPWRNSITLLLGLQTATAENGARLVFGPDPRQPVTSVRISFENRDRRNRAALIILLASTVLGVGASIVASRFVRQV